MSKPIELTDGNFEAEVLNSDVPVLVDFWAEWCGPCKMIAPAVEELATEYDGKAKVGKVNVDMHRRYAQEFGIRGIPALLIFKGGKLVDTLVGAYPKNHIKQKLEEHI